MQEGQGFDKLSPNGLEHAMHAHPDGTISIQVNGEHRRVRAGLTLVQLAADLGLAPEKVAVERNLEVVPRSTLGAVRVEDGDEIEIVHFVGGGDHSSAVSAYNCNADGPPIELGTMSIVDAKHLIEERWPFADIFFERAEDAVEKTMFGFYRSDRDFIEINLAGRELIIVRHEPNLDRVGWLKKLVAPREYLVELSSRDELEKLVDAYFRSSDEAYAIMQTYPNKWRGR